jgi:hypothetical protein
MSLLSGILKIVAGAAEIAGGALVEAGTLGGGTPLALFLIGSGAGMVFSGIGTLLNNRPLSGYATAEKNPIGPWEVIYGQTRTGGICVYDNTWGDNDQMRDLVFVLAAHPCQSVDEVLFDMQRVQIDTTAIPTSAKAGYSIATPVTGSGTSFTPVQQTVNITSITRSADGVVTVVLSANIPYLTANDRITIQNVTTDASLNGTFPVAEIISQTGSEVTFTYLNGGTAVTIDSQGQAKTNWPDYGRNVYVEYLLGNQTLGQTFAGMTAGTPWQGTGKLVTPLSPENAGGTAAPNPWTAFCSLAGMTAVFVRLQYQQKYFPQGTPQISFLVTGKNDIFDPRTSTYSYTTNSALCIADFLNQGDLTDSRNRHPWGYGAAYGTEIDTTALTADANTCDEDVDLVIGGTEKRYTCNGRFNLEMRRGEILQNLLSSCGGRLTYTGGLYAVNPARWNTPISGTVDLQAIAAGPMKWSPTVSARDLYNGVKGTYISRFNGYVSGDFPYYAQDANHGYDPDDEFPQYNGDINLAADGGQRRWLDIQLPFTTSSATAQRLAKIELLRRRHFGTGTFQCNMSAYQYVPLDVISCDSTFLNFSGKELEVSAVRLRSEKSNEGWLLGTEIDLQETDSNIYVWSTEEELSPSGYVISNYPHNVVIEQVPYPWSPGYVSPLSGDAYEGMGASFGLQPIYGTDASGNGIIEMQIKGQSPINVLDKEIASPLCIVTGNTSGGSLPDGEYVVALTAADAGSAPFKLTDYQAFGHASISGGSGSGSISTAITWGSGDDGGKLYMGRWTTFEDGYVFHHVADLDSSVSSHTITTFNQTTPGGIDTIFDHFSILLRQVVHSGPWAQVVAGVTSTTITIQGPTSASMTLNQWAGYNLAVLAKVDTTQEIPLIFIPIASSTASATDGTFTLTVGGNSLSHTLPDLTTLLAPNDVVSMCFKATFSSTGFLDSGLENAFYPSGATSVDAGNVAVVLTGADVGDIQPIASVSGGTAFTLANSWTITPSTGDLVVICNAGDLPEIPTAKIQTSKALTGTMASPSVLNEADSVWLFRVRTEDKDGNHCDDSLIPWRIAYIEGQAGSSEVIGEWEPYDIQANSADALWPDQFQFDAKQSYTFLADGSVQAQVKLTGVATVNTFISGSQPPTLFVGNVTTSTTGGSLPGGQTIYVAICGMDASTHLTAASNVIEVVTPPGTDTNTFTIDSILWPSEPIGVGNWALFASTDRQAMCAQATGSGLVTSITFSGPLAVTTWAMPDGNFAKIRPKVKPLLHGGVLGAGITSVTGNLIVSSECVDATLHDDWTGRQLILIGRPNGSTPFASYNIAAFDASAGAFTLDRTASEALAGDAFVVTFHGYDNLSNPTVFTDAGIENALNVDQVTLLPNPFCGLTANFEAGNMVRIIAGTNEGATAHIVSNTATSYTFDQPLIMDSTSVLIVEGNLWQNGQDQTVVNNVSYTQHLSFDLPTANYLKQSMLIGGYSVGVDGMEAKEAPVRMLYVYGQQTAATQIPGATLLFGENTQGQPADVVLNGTCNVNIANTAGIVNTSAVNSPSWLAFAWTPPTGLPIAIDVYRFAQGASLPGTVIGTVYLNPGVTTLQSGDFASNIQINVNDSLYGKVTQVGSGTPGQRVTVQLYWTPQAPAVGS